MRRFVSLGALTLFFICVTPYRLSAQSLAAPPVPRAVLAVEDALATRETFALLHADVGHIASAEQALIETSGLTFILSLWSSQGFISEAFSDPGINWREEVDHFIGAVYVDNGSFGGVAVLLGDFPAESITRLLERTHTAEEIELASEPGYLVTLRDPTTCEIKGPYALRMGRNQMMFGAAAAVESTLERLAREASPEQDLETWRTFREGKALTLASWRIPDNIADAFDHPLASLILGKVLGEFEESDRIYLGASIDAPPTGVALLGEVHASNPEWPKRVESDYRTWRETAAENPPVDAAARYQVWRHVTVVAEGRRLLFRLLAGEFFDDFKNVLGEIFRKAAEQTDVKFANPQTERTLAPHQITKFLPAVSHDDLKDFDPTENPYYEVGVYSGPFGLMVKAVSWWESENGAVPAISLDAESVALPNIDLLEARGERARAKLFVTQVRGTDETNLLREESCGWDRNDEGTALDPTQRSVYVDNDQFMITTVQGRKRVRLKQGARIKDVTGLSGYFRLRLPTRTETKRIEMPFEEQVFEVGGVRLKLNGKAGELRYHVSGEPDPVLHVRALNASAKYLEPAGASTWESLFDRGKWVTNRFRGKPESVELVFVREETTNDYPFSLETLAMKREPPPFEAKPVVTPVSGREFVARFSSVNYEFPCEKGKPEVRVGPFALCAVMGRGVRNQLFARYKVLAPEAIFLEQSLSSVELAVPPVSVPDRGAEARTAAAASGFVKLRGSQKRKRLEGSASLATDLPEDATSEGLGTARGRLIVRLPTELTRARLDITEPGNETSHADGWSAKLKMISGSSYSLDLKGPRDRLLQFVAYDDQGRRLAISSSTVSKPMYKASEWKCWLTIHGVPKNLDIIFAAAQDRLEYGFQAPVSE